MRAPVCVALDARSEAEILELATAVSPYVQVFKVGLTAFTACGPGVVTALAPLGPVFLDLKLHDIPAQVAGAAAAAATLGATFVTVHAAGGEEMVAAAVEGAGPEATVLAVTILTSLDDPSLDALGIRGPVPEAVARLARSAVDAGAGGLVCSPLEVAGLRSRFGSVGAGGPYLVVPGIRSAATGDDDQRRTMSARAALEAGADLLVVGRPITGAPDPVRAARELAAELEGVTG